MGLIKLSKLTRAEFSPKKAAGVFATGFFCSNGSRSPSKSFRLLLFCLFKMSLTGDEVACNADLLRFVITSKSSKSEPGVSPPSELLA